MNYTDKYRVIIRWVWYNCCNNLWICD